MCFDSSWRGLDMTCLEAEEDPLLAAWIGCPYLDNAVFCYIFILDIMQCLAITLSWIRILKFKKKCVFREYWTRDLRLKGI